MDATVTYSLPGKGGDLVLRKLTVGESEDILLQASGGGREPMAVGLRQRQLRREFCLLQVGGLRVSRDLTAGAIIATLEPVVVDLIDAAIAAEHDARPEDIKDFLGTRRTGPAARVTATAGP